MSEGSQPNTEAVSRLSKIEMIVKSIVKVVQTYSSKAGECQIHGVRSDDQIKSKRGQRQENRPIQTGKCWKTGTQGHMTNRHSQGSGD